MMMITSCLKDDMIDWLMRRLVLLDNLQKSIHKLTTGGAAYTSPIIRIHQLGLYLPFSACRTNQTHRDSLSLVSCPDGLSHSPTP